MATQRQPHKQKHQLYVPMAHQIIGADPSQFQLQNPSNFGSIQQQIQQSVTATQPLFDAQEQYMAEVGGRGISFALYQQQLNNMVGALSIPPIVPTATQFGGVGSGAGGTFS